jgi:hypothetical protein
MSTAEQVLHEYLLGSIIEGNSETKNWDDEDIRTQFKDGNSYRGSFKKGYMDGQGEYSWKLSGVRYTGHFQRNKITGSGKYNWSDGSVYSGDVEESLRNGYGKFQFVNQYSMYDGEWKMGIRQGTGIMHFNENTNAYYDGEWHLSSKTGSGKMVYPSGASYYGEWKNNIKTGIGKMVWKYSDIHHVYDGMWQQGKPHGLGIYYWLYPTDADELVIQKAKRNYFDGEWVDGKRQGRGTFFYSDGSVYTGEWKENRKHGKGTFIDTNGNVYSGIFVEDKQDFIDRTAEPTSGPVLYLDDLRVASSSREYQQLQSLLFRYYNKLKEIYVYYSNLPGSLSDESLYLNNLQLSQFLIDTEIISVDGNIGLCSMYRDAYLIKKKQLLLTIYQIFLNLLQRVTYYQVENLV